MDKVSLVKQCQSGDREAFGILYQTYLAPMREVVAYYIHNADIEQDVLHDGFLIAFTSIGSLKNGAKIEAWLTSIMKNVSLQYLKDESSHISVPMSDTAIADNTVASVDNARELTWEELDKIINKLPDGYGKVFRLAVLDGLSHKEIAALLGIAPHSSSSQLTHAKAMLRRMITQYRVEMGILSILGIILLIWHGLFKNREDAPSTPVISKNADKETPLVTDSIVDANSGNDSIAPSPKMLYKAIQYPETQKNIAEVTISTDSIPAVKNDSITNDTIRVIPNIINREELIAQENYPPQQSEKPDWSLSLAYAGSLEQNDLNRYRIPNPDHPDVEGPDGEIEVTEKTRHYMPLVIGLSVNKSLTSRWSVETGLRYTFLRSDFLSQSKVMDMETIQRIHYIGVPLKFNYRIFTYNGFSLYGQGGSALDIPVNGSQSILEYSPQLGNSTNTTIYIHAPLQWSVEGGLGIQYHFTPSFCIYAEPSFKYYFNPGSDIKTIRQDKPFEFTIPIGLRLTW
ncbi:sigma-70 family RNA polymerase sigma factor [uncultured Duncaniella sp.]|uniref:sigma-70 family RNA polymerase sigma factor n=2 Tax=Muribaculaceae TaxID=2005473 RepID=UPI0025B6D85B|nr:sigma-70 family RNA polymerase sigma factor [uncultured Duncaniella sp.]